MAQAKSKFARDVVDQMYTRVAKGWLEQQPQLSEVQRDFLKQARDFYEVMAQEESDDPAVRFAAAQAYRNAGRIDQKLGSYAGCPGITSPGDRVDEQLVREYPDHYEYRRTWPRHNCRSEIHWVPRSRSPRPSRLVVVRLKFVKHSPRSFLRILTTRWKAYFVCKSLRCGKTRSGDGTSGLKAAREAVEQWRNFGDDLHKGRQSYRYDFTSSLSNLGVMLKSQGQYEESVQILREAIAYGEQLLEEAPSDLGRSNLAEYWANLGNGLRHLGQLDEAIAAFQQVVELTEQLVSNRPGEPELLQLLAAAVEDLGTMQRASGLPKEAEQNYRRVLELQRRFDEAFPEAAATGGWQTDRAISHYRLGVLLEHSGRHKEAADEFRLAIEINRPRNPTHTVAYLGKLGAVQYRLGQFNEAIEIFQQSEKLAREVLEADSRIHGREHPETLSSMNELAWALTYQGKFEEARTLAQQALALQQRVLGREHPATLTTQDTLAKALEGLGHWAEARALREEVLKLSDGKDVQVTYDSMAGYMNGLALNIALTVDASTDDRQCAIDLAKQAVELDLANNEPWRTLGVAHAVSGHWQKSLEAFEHALKLGYRDELVPPSTLERLRQSDDGDDDLRDELLEFLRENTGESQTVKRSRTNSATAGEQNSQTSDTE